MKVSDHQRLLAQYVASGSEAAFGELVRRYVNLVYSTAVRMVDGDSHQAEDITQIVFADLARMARTLSPQLMLGGWLHRHTCFVASKAMRKERRRQLRERQALEMNTFEDHSATHLGSVAPILDEVINQLGTDDRKAILLRFFEQWDFRSIGAALGSTEDAARKRVHRALEKLQLLLKARGVTISVVALGSALGVQAVTTAPVGLAASVTATALATSATGTSATLTFLDIMTLTKLKVGIIGAVAVAVTLPIVVYQRQHAKLRTENELLREQLKEFNALTTENERLSNLVAQANRPAPLANTDFAELMRLRGEVGRLRQENTGLRTVSTPRGVLPSPPTDLASTVAQHKLRYAEEILQETEARFKGGLATQAEYDQVRFARDIAAAESREDGVRVKQLKHELAEKAFLGIEARYNSGLATSEQYARAKAERDLAVAELNENQLDVARIKLEAEDARLKLVESKQGVGQATRVEYLRAKLARDIAAAEFDHQTKINGASDGAR
ncbi:MAG: sigma-70 family RNA polymerase sigma factor [Verrucomicrobiales bacterium]|nr:sigma-70 family RNA polymerase sigma factor [Verrucomicrobiales bacterium]